MPETARAKVYNHPCYSEEAHRYYARMQVAVAPACNIQRNYCGRHYFNSRFKEPIACVSDSMTEDAAVFGGQKNMYDGLENAKALYKPEMIAVSTTCMAEVVGAHRPTVRVPPHSDMLVGRLIQSLGNQASGADH
ncbi:MAG: nitrogenase component 1 [Holophaga sp.]|nr:nitrogenase component 1 [Holophaga sp.]